MRKSNLIQLVFIVFVLIIFTVGCKKPAGDLSNNNSDVVGRYRGFNLLGKFDVGWSNPGYFEEDFEMIHALGFNFVRLPIDYRTYTAEGNWYEYSEDALAQIDDAISWGMSYDIHVNLNLHRAPGFCVNKSNTLPANQALDLWTDTIAQEAFITHWEMFAERYKDIPANALSFNLINEPAGVSSDVYAAIALKAINAIKKIDPDRTVHIDGVDYGNAPVIELADVKNVVQSFHNYQPFTLTHYKSSWVQGSDNWPVPKWPVYNFANGLYGPGKADLHDPFTIKGSFKKNTVVTIQIHQVSTRADFNISLDDSVIYSHIFEPADGDGEWKQVVSTQWGYQNIYNRDYSVLLPVDGEILSFYIDNGDWLTFNKIVIKTTGKTFELLPGRTGYGIKPNSIRITSDGEVQLMDGSSGTLISPQLEEWIDFSKTRNVPIIVGEFGVYNKTPHYVTLLYLEDMLNLMKENNIGFALWNFRGAFGVLDSERSDVTYEDYNGHQLDRKMLDLLQKY